MTELNFARCAENSTTSIKKDRETLDRMIDLVSRSNGHDASVAKSPDPLRGMTINEKVAHYVLEMTENFTMQDAWKFIKDKDPKFSDKLNRQSMSTALWKMKKSGDIKIIIPKRENRLRFTQRNKIMKLTRQRQRGEDRPRLCATT